MTERKRQVSSITHNPREGWLYKGHLLDMICSDSEQIRDMALRWKGIQAYLLALPERTKHEQAIVAFAEKFLDAMEKANDSLDQITDDAADDDERNEREVYHGR